MFEIESALIAPARKKKPEAEKAPFVAPEGYEWTSGRQFQDPIVGMIFIPVKHERRHGKFYVNWLFAMERYVDRPTVITDHVGPDAEQNCCVKIAADGGVFKYHFSRGWVLTKDKVPATLAPESLVLQDIIPFEIGKVPQNFTGTGPRGTWEFSDEEFCENQIVRLVPYATHPVTREFTHPGDNLFEDHHGANQSHRDLWGAVGTIDSVSWLGWDDGARPVRKVQYHYDDGYRAARITLENGTQVMWRVESLLRLCDEEHPSVLLRKKLEGTESELKSTQNQLASAQEKIDFLSRELKESTGRVNPEMQELYTTVQKLLTQYFLNGEISTSDSEDAKVFDQLVLAYRAARATINRKGEEQDDVSDSSAD